MPKSISVDNEFVEDKNNSLALFSPLKGYMITEMNIMNIIANINPTPHVMNIVRTYLHQLFLP